MLVLTRKQNEVIRIGKDIQVVVVELLHGSKVRLGIKAPPEVAVDRQEVYEAKRRNPRVTCPRCGDNRAKSNARGPDHVWCTPCGGLVPVNYASDEEEPGYNDPVRSAIANEQERSRDHRR